MFDDRPEPDGEEIADLADAARSSDPSAVYDDVDALPGWWRELVDEFAEHDLRPYRPSRLADGEITYEVVESLEERLDVDIVIKSAAPRQPDSWRFVVDGTTAVTTTHERMPEGYSRYGVTSGELIEAVSEVALEGS